MAGTISKKMLISTLLIDAAKIRSGTSRVVATRKRKSPYDKTQFIRPPVFYGLSNQQLSSAMQSSASESSTLKEHFIEL